MSKRNNDDNDLKERGVNTEIAGLKAEITSLTLLNEMYKKTIDELKNINTQMTEEFSAIKRERDKLKDRNEDLVKINEELTENLEAVKSYTRDSQVELIRKLEEASSQINKLQKTLYMRDSELAAARSANDGLKKKVIELEGTLKATNEKCDKKKETAYYYVNDVLQTTALHLKHENEKLDRINMSLIQERNDLSEQLDDRDSEIHDLKKKIIRLENVIESCNSRVRNAFDHALELEKENSYYKRQVSHVQTAFEDLMTKLEAEKR